MKILHVIQNIDQDTLLLIIGGAVALLFLMILDLLTGYFKIRRKAKKKLSTEVPILEELQDQLSVIANHASLYANSLGTEGAKLLFELEGIVKEQQEILETIEICLNNNEIADLKNFYEGYDEQTPKQKKYWITRSQHLIDLLGKKIHEISERSTNLGLPKMSRRENTIENLKRWKIIK